MTTLMNEHVITFLNSQAQPDWDRVQNEEQTQHHGPYIVREKFVELDECPDMYLVNCIHRGNWTSSPVELFAYSEDGPAVHIHFYTTKATARAMWADIEDMVPFTVSTVSFAK